LSQVLAAAFSTAFAPFAFVSVKSTCSPAAGPKPAPVSLSNVTVNVCGWPISFVADGAIEILAATHAFVAFGPSPTFASPVVLVSKTPPTETVVVACKVVVPAVADVIVTSQVPVAPTVLQFCVAGVPGPAMMFTVQTVPAGAFAKPEPSLTLMWQCNVCCVPTGFAAVSGVN